MTQTTRLLYDQNQLANICDLLLERLDEILERTKVKLKRDGTMFVGVCPIHCGDNPGAFNLYREGKKTNGYWCCWTHKCNKIFAPNMIGFIRAMLSSRHKDYCWRTEGDPIYPFAKTLEWINNFLGEDIKKINEKRKIDSLNKVSEIKEEKNKGFDVNILQERLKIPSYYFVRRGFSEEILTKYMIGYCDTKGKKQYKRSVVPILNDASNLIMSCSGRSIYEKCEKCKLYHCSYFPCPTHEFASKVYCKWKHLGNPHSYLYNYWNANKYIKKSKTAVLVEGSADVWKLEELGIKNSIALMGLSLTDAQSLILETSGAMNIVDMLDNDPAGRKAAELIRSQTDRIYRWHRYAYIGHDPGELTKETVKPIREFLEKLQ